MALSKSMVKIIENPKQLTISENNGHANYTDFAD